LASSAAGISIEAAALNETSRDITTINKHKIALFILVHLKFRGKTTLKYLKVFNGPEGLKMRGRGLEAVNI
jgi:hypothetical protein